MSSNEMPANVQNIINLLDGKETRMEQPAAPTVVSPESTPSHAGYDAVVVAPSIPTPTSSLRALATEFLAALDKAEQPFSQRLAADPEMRRQVIRHLGVVRGYRDELLDLGVAPWLRWKDLKDSDAISDRNELVEDAAEDDDVIDAVMNDLDFDIVVEKFPEDAARYVKNALGDMDTYDIVEGHGADNFAENEDVKEEVLKHAEAKEIIEYVDESDLAEVKGVREAVLEQLEPSEIRMMATTKEVRELVLDTLEAPDYEKLAVSQLIREQIVATLDKADIEFAIAKNPSLGAYVVSARVNELATAVAASLKDASEALEAAKTLVADAQKNLTGLRS